MSDMNGQTPNIPHVIPTVLETASIGTMTITGTTADGTIVRVVLLTVGAPGRTFSILLTQDDAVRWGKQLIQEGSGLIL